MLLLLINSQKVVINDWHYIVRLCMPDQDPTIRCSRSLFRLALIPRLIEEKRQLYIHLISTSTINTKSK
jgi:hypothetical protein